MAMMPSSLYISVLIAENEHAMRKDLVEQAVATLGVIGARDIVPGNEFGAGGEAIHEMGTARMGRDPRTSVLNAYNQAHDVPNLFVTDGACMSSSACQNPSLTYMALTDEARFGDTAQDVFEAMLLAGARF